MRTDMIAELDAINIYEEMAALTNEETSGRYFLTLPEKRKCL
jgi:rubrerythrin